MTKQADCDYFWLCYTLYMNEPTVTIYSATWCAFCHAAKAYLDDKQIKYTDHDIEAEPGAAKECVDKSGQTGIPVLDINGTIIVGFDRPKIDAALASAGL